jgi:hypothetical protein
MANKNRAAALGRLQIGFNRNEKVILSTRFATAS